MASMTIQQVARLADVSRSTVSRVLNNHPSVRPLVRDRVLRIIDEHDYAPQAAARSLVRQQSCVLGLLIPRSAAFIFSDPFFSGVIEGITAACTRRGYILMLSMLTDAPGQAFYQRILRSRHFDGVIMLSSDIDDPVLPLLLRDQTPLVLVGRHPFFQQVLSVDVANREGARDAVLHLVGLGHQRIATITGPLQMAAALDRRDGYKQALLEAGLLIRPELLVEGDFTQQGGYQAMLRVLALTPRPTAVFAASDTMALGALRAMQEAGVVVPRDMALIGFDDLPITSFASPSLTTMRQPIYEMGTAAVDLLIDQLECPSSEPTRVCLPATLITRDSCGGRVVQRTAQKSV
jgi:LacI family transcriptional regulator